MKQGILTIVNPTTKWEPFTVIDGTASSLLLIYFGILSKNTSGQVL